MSKPKRPKDFLKVPQYVGGNAALKVFLDKNLKYPKEALDGKIEGEVEAEYHVDGLGKIKKVKILKGIGYGCDEEVIRLVKLLIFQKAVNRGMKTLTRKTLKINFQLPKLKTVQVKYQIIDKPKKSNSSSKNKYGYTITINPKN